jgi:Holliday junction resolvasome RuvABC endonuclease subunit
MSIIVGFDVSSTTIGWGCLKVDKNDFSYVDSGYFKPPKKGDLFQRLAKTKASIQKLLKQLKPNHIGIEEIVQFMPNKTKASTIITLAVYNRMVGLVAHDYIGNSPQLCNVLAIRHALKLSKDLPSKEEIPELVAQHLNISFPYEYKKKSKEIKTESFDRADGLAVAIYCAKFLIK